MKKVYIVIFCMAKGEEECAIHGVFTTRKKAENYVKRYKPKEYEQYLEIEEWRIQ